MNYQQIILCALTPVVVGSIVPLISILIAKRNRKIESKYNQNNFVIHAPNFAIWLAIIILLIATTILVLLNVFSEVRIVANILVIIFLIFVLFACYAFIREKTVVNNDKITHTPIIGHKKELVFSDIKYINVKFQQGYISYRLIGHDDKKIFALSSQYTGVNVFLDKVQRLGIEIRDY